MDHLRARPKWPHRALVAVVIAAIGGAVAYVAFTVATRDTSETKTFAMVAMVEFTIVGALILERRPHQPVGRICLAIGVLLFASGALQVGIAALGALPGPLPPVGLAMDTLLPLLAFPVAYLLGPVLNSRYPNGSTPGSEGRIQDVVIALAGAATAIALIQPRVDQLAPGLAFATAYVVSSAGLVARYRRSGLVERAQIRWFGAAIATTVALAVAVLLTLILDVIPLEEGLVSALFGLFWLSFLLPPLAIGIAILRYRLYDIDRIISNAIGYGIVTVLLFGLYATALTALTALSPLQDLGAPGIAAATLVAAALFNPVRTRVQAVVDRRFHRARYDADRIAAGFAAGLRDQLDLRTIAAELDRTATLAMEPSSSGVWLRTRTAFR